MESHTEDLSQGLQSTHLGDNIDNSTHEITEQSEQNKETANAGTRLGFELVKCKAKTKPKDLDEEPKVTTTKRHISSFESPKIYPKNKNLVPKKATQPETNQPLQNTVIHTQTSILETDGPQVADYVQQQQLVGSPATDIYTECENGAHGENQHTLPSQEIGSDPGDQIKDFVVLHTEEDSEIAENVKEHLLQVRPDLTIERFSNIDVGQSHFVSLASLPFKYSSILVLVTDNLVSDKYTRYLTEMLQTFGLKNTIGKEDQVIPIWTQPKKRWNNNPELMPLTPLTGLDFWKYSDSEILREGYLRCLKNTIESRRKKIKIMT